MSTPVLSELQKFLKPIVDFAESTDDSDESSDEDGGNVRFGHIQIPPYRLGKVSLLESVRQISMKANRFNAEMIFVVSAREKELGIGVKDDGKVTPVILTFSELIDALRASKKGARNGQWVTAPKPPWKKGQALPIEVVLVICLDPLMPADCALCLLGAVRWAIDQASSWDQTDIRVLTLSAEKEFNFLSEVVSFLAPDKQVASVDLSVRGPQDGTSGSWIIVQPGPGGYAGRILEKLRAGTDCRRLILSFDERLREQFEQQMRDTEKPTVEFRTVEATVSVDPLLHLERSEQGPKILFITFQGEVPFLPLQIQNFDELYLVLGTSGIFKKAWDEISRQVINLAHWASMGDRRLQSWWASQPSIPTRIVYTAGVPLEQFLQGGGSRLRLVENAQLGGFIASLADIASWGIDPGAALDCFVRQSQRAQEMSLRLHTQRLITESGLDLADKEAEVFRAVVSLLGYDHRLALFVALNCRPEVRRVKVQLAAMLKYSTNQVVLIHESVFNDRKKYNTVLRGCHGLGSSMARQGTMWLNLGLLKRHQKMVEQQNEDGAPEDTLSDLVRVFPDKVSLIGTEIGEILDRLVKLGVSVDNTVSVAQETNQLSSEAMEEISDHLVSAFTHNLVVTENFSPDEQDAPRLSHKVMSTWLGLTQAGRARLININSYLKKEKACGFGISCDFDRNKEGHHFFNDWTYIPGITVAKWRSQFESDVTFYEILNTDVEREGNV
ncbi:uncharacterized protein FSUBG_13433 [Fusarium subglutinans]|uniref:Uncharacterized protein n=1 Tax=Gibberella subglutinans TaxID=42677 RepID=A0A8H5KYA5_GIBSU|nr:uncharacterized protein FSUBG_13433 [Fusarium subglutinans]KAF5580280.1 hypothetical protein FSUBG_13433 [Fusarium subglutinans]